MSLVKNIYQISDWTAVAQNGIGASAVYDCSANYETMLSIQSFLDSTTAHTGTEFVVQISSNNSGNEDWEDLARYIDLVGTAATFAITDNPANAGATTLNGNVPAGFAIAGVVGRFVAIKDATLINSELMWINAYTLSTSIGIKDGITNSHAQNSNVYNIASTRVISIPFGTNRVRVNVNNYYSSGGSSMNFKVRASIVTGL